MEPVTTNRFPIFAAWCYVIARRLGYREEEAKSLAVTRARLGAAAKAGNLGGGRKPRGHAIGGDRGAPAAPEKLEQIPFVGMRPYVTRIHGERRGAMHSGEGLEVVTPRDYDVSVTRKLGEAYPSVLRVLEALAAQIPPEELNKAGYHLWEEFAPMVRDAGGRESKPHFGQRGVFDPAKVERLTAELAREHLQKAA
jgi:hypothetical protein